jgi:sugar O-acyltransferase (sialic acid O-acetyltransferase NeuD family)
MSTKPIIILGSGGHAKVCLEILKILDYEIIGVAGPDLSGKTFLGAPVIGSDEDVLSYSANEVRLVNGVGSIGNPTIRRNLFNSYKKQGYYFQTIIHPSAIISSDVHLGEGAQIMAGCVIQPGCFIDENSIINTRASVDHDCRIGKHVHLAPGVTLSGGVQIGNETHVGTSGTIIQNICVGYECIVGAGALVISDVKNKTTVMGVPAKEVM